MTVKLVGSMAENWIDQMVGSMAGSCTEMTNVMRAGWMAVKMAG